MPIKNLKNAEDQYQINIRNHQASEGTPKTTTQFKLKLSFKTGVSEFGRHQPHVYPTSTIEPTGTSPSNLPSPAIARSPRVTLSSENVLPTALKTGTEHPNQ